MNKKPKGKSPKAPLKANIPAKIISPIYPSVEKMLEGKSLYVFLGLAAFLVLVVFRHFITFRDLYLYKDIGCDTVTYWWPHYVQFSHYIHTNGIPKWAFNYGMGQNVYAFGIEDPFTLFLCLLPEDSIPYGIIFMEIIKIIGGGLFFYLFLRTLNISRLASVVGGLLYSFSGYMILGSGWYLVSAEAFYIAMVLYCAERFLRHGVWYLLPIPFCLVGILQPFYIYLDAILLTVYCITRGLLNNQKWKEIIISLFKIGGLALFGVLLGSVFIFANVYQLIDNPRVSGQASLVKALSSTPMFQLTPSHLSQMAVYRMFSNDLMGAGSVFQQGGSNYLEAPILYIGLLSLLLAPQAFLFFAKRKRYIYLILIAVCLVPMVFIYFRYMFWMFAAPYYRTYTFFLSLLLLYFAIKALTNIDRTYEVHIKTLMVTLVILLFLLYGNFSNNVITVVDKALRNAAAFFLVIYTGLIYMLGTKKYKIYAVGGLAFFLCIELAYFSNITVNHRSVVSYDELHQKVDYNDYTVEGVSYLNSIDHGFYRLRKDYKTDVTKYACLNDPEMQHYNGLTNYAEWNQPNYVRFLQELHVNNYDDPIYSKWLYGIPDRDLLWTMASVKYMFSERPLGTYNPVSFIPLTTVGNVNVLKSNFCLPFGYAYKKYIPISEFRKLKNDLYRDIMLLNATVVDDTDLAAFNGVAQWGGKDRIPDTLQYVMYMNFVKELRKDSLNISHFDQNNIKGTIKLDAKEVLFFSIPFDQGWKADVDGKPAKIFRVNVGFSGLVLDKGEHTVELHYEVPYLASGAYVSLATLLLYCFAFVKFRKRKI